MCDVKEKSEMVAVQNAFRDRELFSFIHTSFNLCIQRLELARHWGLVCPCCGILRFNSNKRVRCERSSRRLHQARVFLIGLKNDILRSIPDNDSLPSFDGNQTLLEWTAYSMRMTVIDVSRKTHQYSKVPLRICEADDPAQAQICYDQLAAIPDERLDVQLRTLKETVFDALKDLQFV